MKVVVKYFDKLQAEKTTPVSHQLVTDGQGQTIHELSSCDTSADTPMDVDENCAAVSQPMKTPQKTLSLSLCLEKLDLPVIYLPIVLLPMTIP